MKHAYLILLGVTFYLFTFSTCRKDNDEEFFIEATIDGVKWRAKSYGDFTATKSDNSQMKIFIDSTVSTAATFSFFTNATLNSFYDGTAEFELTDGYLAPFDSKLKLKWQTNYERNVAEYYITRSFAEPADFKIIDTIPAGGNSNTVRSYSVDLPDVEIPYLDQLKYRLLLGLTGGSYSYASVYTPDLVPGKAQIVFADRKGKVYFPVRSDQNQISITSYDPATSERRGTFSFNYKDESGKIVEVRNGKYHLKR